MTDSLKFGPEWLRNLAGDGCNSSSSISAGGGGGGNSLTTPKYQLAEYRYGREEMLALFDRTYKAPDPLTSFTGLYVPKAQLPLALVHMTDEETRLWNGGVSVSTSRGRGVSADRGTRSARPGGRTGGPHYRGFDDLGEPGPRTESQPFPARTRAFDRPPNERGWSERNGVEPPEWNGGSTSPRKELTRGLSGSFLMESNWRRHRGGGEEDDGWRTNARGDKWVKGSWREADKERADRSGDLDVDDKRADRWEHKGGNRAFDPHPPPLRRNRSNHHDNHDNLPEWAIENPSESGGSFDASGAFHGMYSDDDEDYDRHQDRRGHVGAGGTPQRGSRVRRVSEGNAPHPKNVTPSPMKNDRSLNGERPKSLHAADAKDHHHHQSLADKESRRSLSPIRSPAAPSSPVSQKKSGNNSQAGSAGDTKKRDKSGKQQAKDPSSQPANASVAKAKSKSQTESPKRAEEPKSKSERSSSKAASKAGGGDSSRSSEPHRNAEVSRAPSLQQQQQQQQQQQRQRQQQLQDEYDRSDQLSTSIATSVIESDKMDDHRGAEPDNLNRIEEEVAKLIDGPLDEKPSSGVSVAKQAGVDHSSVSAQEKWFYRDPQGEVQGPFLANEMAEWHKQGYFAPNLLVRRTCDERYTTLGDLVNLCGTVPFKPGTNFPPLKIDPLLPHMNPAGVVPGLPMAGGGMPKPSGLEDPLLLYQIQQYQLMQSQQMFLKQLRATAIGKLSQSEQWSSMSPVEQNQLVMQYMRSIDPDIADVPPQLPNSFMPNISQLQQSAPPSSSVLQLFPQLQAKSPADAGQNHHAMNAQNLSSKPIDPIKQLIQQMGGMRNLPPMPQAAMAPSPPQPPPQDDNPLKSWIRQLAVNSNGHVQPPPPHLQAQSKSPAMDSVWHQPPPHLTTAFNAQSWMSQVGAIQPSIPPGQMSLWDTHPKEMKTEQQILEEQNLKMQEEKKKEELRQQEEMERHQAEERAKRQQQEEEMVRLKIVEEAAKREEAERRKREEEKKRREEEKRRQEEEQRKVEEKRRKEDERKREEKRKMDEEANRKKQEEEKRKRDELKRQEEKLRKEEEKRKKIEDEQRRQEEERSRKEEEARKKAEAAEQARKAEQRRREAEALRKLQERSKAPWAQAPPAPPPTAQASLADIQRLEKEKRAEELRLQQLMQQQQLAQQKAAQETQDALIDAAKRLQFKWAEKVASASSSDQVKSLAQIQQEEQERVAKVKQQERERQEKEKAVQKEVAAVPIQNASIWGAASQSLNWSNPANASGQMYGAGSGGFWDEPAPKVNQPAQKPANVATPKQVQKQQPVAKSPAQVQQQQQQQQQQNNKAGKSKNKKEEELVKKLFEQNTAKTDDFTQWCNKALSGLQVSVDIPTFIGFLRDIEAAYEVKEYVRLYLGEGKQCSEFAKQFLEKRSKWRSAQRPQTQADDLCKPAPAINPNASTEFQEVKSKSKKPKKGKMFKVDSKMLGFSVMSAPDRINVGDRDYADGV